MKKLLLIVIILFGCVQENNSVNDDGTCKKQVYLNYLFILNNIQAEKNDPNVSEKRKQDARVAELLIYDSLYECKKKKNE